jgi:hypothetical protein
MKDLPKGLVIATTILVFSLTAIIRSNKKTRNNYSITNEINNQSSIKPGITLHVSLLGMNGGISSVFYVGSKIKLSNLCDTLTILDKMGVGFMLLHPVLLNNNFEQIIKNTTKTSLGIGLV